MAKIVQLKDTETGENIYPISATSMEGEVPEHTHDASDIKSGTIPIINGGTGADTIPGYLKQAFPSALSSGSVPLLGSGWDNNGYISIANLRTAMGIADYIVEQGTSGIWSFRKWNSGVAECWGKNTASVKTTTALGNVYYGTMWTSLAFPSSLFKEAPATSIKIDSPDADCWVTSAPPTATQLGLALMMAPMNNETKSTTTSIYAKGRWK